MFSKYTDLFFNKKVTLKEASPVASSSSDEKDKPAAKSRALQRRVSWRASTDSIPSLIQTDEVEEGDEDGRKSISVSALGRPFQISQWPAMDPLISKRRSAMRVGKKSSTGSLTSRAMNSCGSCCGRCAAGTGNSKEAVYGVIDGPTVKITHRNILPVDYLATYQGKIKAKATAIINPDGSGHTYETLNLASDALAKILKPLVEEGLASIPEEHIQDPSFEPCIAIARNPCEICASAILAVWKLGLPYLPLRTYENPAWRISTIIESIKPMMVIGMAFDQTLEEATQDTCPLLTFESLWDTVASQMTSEKPLSQAERKKQLTIAKLEELRKQRDQTDPSQRIICILHRFNGEGKVVPTCIRTETIWNRLHAEWRAFPYRRNEKVVLHASVDSSEFLGQFLAPLLKGHTIVMVDKHNLYGFLQAMQRWKLRRLTVFPELLYAMVTIMQFITILRNRSESTVKLNFFDTVKYWFCTGAAIRYELALSFFMSCPKSAILVNIFGCKELLSFACFEIFKCAKDLRDGNYFEIIPMGRPVMNTRVYILDPNEHITEGSDLGEIFVTGPGIALHPTLTNAHAVSFSAQKGEYIATTIPNPFLEEEKDKKKKSMYQALLKTKDYGRLVYRAKGARSCCRKKITLQFSGNTECELVVENYRMNTNEIVSHLSQIPGVKFCHVMIYRPGTPSKALLAFICVSQKHPVSKDEIHLFLRARMPEYLLPTLIIIPGIPIKDHKINLTLLVETYLKDRVCKTHENWQELVGPEIENDSREMKAVKSLCKTLYYTCGVSEEWAASHLDWTLTELRIPFTSTPAIYKELLRHGYSITMEDFFSVKQVKDILNMMIAHSPVPAPEIALRLVESSNMYANEVITSAHKREIIKLFVQSNMCDCGVSNKRTLIQYCGLNNKDLELILTSIWPLIVYKYYSIAVRDRSTRKIVAALLNADCRDKAYCQQWQTLAQEHPTKYRMGIIDQVDESLAKHGLINSRYSLNGMGSLFFMYDSVMIKDFEKSIQILEMLFTQAIQIAKSAGFRSIHVTIYDYVLAEFVVEAFNFEVVDYMQANMYKARDGTKPFHLAPDHVTGTVLYKLL